MKIKETTYIYTLSCPVSGLVRYVGKSDDPKHRLLRHIRCDDISKKSSWIVSLKNKNLLPVLDIIDEVPWCDWKIHECNYIKMFLSCGAKLVNSTLGGDGGQTLEIRKRMSLKNKGKDFLSPEQRIAANQVLLNYVKSNQPWNKGKRYKVYLTDEERHKKSLAQIGKHGGKPVLQYDLEGNFIKEWKTAYQIQKDLKIDFKLISRCCINNSTTKGFMWVFKNGEIENKITPANLKTIKLKEVSQFDKNNNLIKIYSSPKETEQDGFNLKCVSASCLSNNKYKGFYWRY